MNPSEAPLYPELARSIATALRELDQIPGVRRALLDRLARWVATQRAAGPPSRLVFICTHNSRRSHMAQLWAQTAAHVFGVDGIESFSGGTEATAFDERAVAAIERAGFVVARSSGGDNPVYTVRFHEDGPTMEAFSKVYDSQPNPKGGFCAVMTCTAADAACPVVFGAAERISIPYQDPKAFDGTEQEAARYDERCRQIAGEMLYVFSKAAT